MSTFVILFLHISILAYALVAGVFLAFSDFIMRSLAITSGSGGVEAMQAINREVFRWVFMTLFLGMAVGSVAIAIYAWVAIGGPAGAMILAAALVYLVFCFGVTVIFNVPMNEALSGMETSSEAARDYWLQTYVPRWTLWNTVRTVASTVSAALLLVGLLWLMQSQA